VDRLCAGRGRFTDFRELSDNPDLQYKRLQKSHVPHIVKFGDAMAAQISLKTKEDVSAACEHVIAQHILTRQPTSSNVSPEHFNVDNLMRNPIPFALPAVPAPGE
jgi:hypothetical protein